MRSTRLQPVDADAPEEFQIPEAAEAPRTVTVPERQITDLLIRGLGQRALTILSTLFTLLLAGSVFWAWMTVLPEPTTLKLIGIGGYALFALALEFVRRR